MSKKLRKEMKENNIFWGGSPMSKLEFHRTYRRTKIKEETMEESLGLGKKVIASKLIPKLNLGFCCQYQNQVSFVHY